MLGDSKHAVVVKRAIVGSARHAVAVETRIAPARAIGVEPHTSIVAAPIVVEPYTSIVPTRASAVEPCARVIGYGARYAVAGGDHVDAMAERA